jgi:integrase
MSKAKTTGRRVRVERNIYRRSTGALEVGVKDGSGAQRWRSVDGGIGAARALRDELLSGRAGGERLAPDRRLGFAGAADIWLAGPVADLRASTRAGYRNAVDRHLRPRYASRRLDDIDAEDLATLVREMRAEGKSEATIAVVLGVTARIYKYAARRLGWTGTTPTAMMLASERPKLAHGQRHPIFEGAQLEQTITAATEPYRTMFTLAALTGARVSELCGLTWADVRVADVEDAEVEFSWQVDRKGRRAPSKTAGSARTVPIPPELAVLLARHRQASQRTSPTDYVFATRSGRPLGQRNVARALRSAETRARDELGRPTFPILHECDEGGNPSQIPRGAVPSMHSFRHTVASRALLAGESIDEVAFLLGHRDGNVTRAVYVREIADGRRRAMRRSRITAEFGSVLEAAALDAGPALPTP